jgi:hypothetical protein
MARVANTATPEKLTKIIRGACPAGVSHAALATTDMDNLVEKHVDLLLDIVRATPRPTSAVMSKAASAAWRCDAHEAVFFSTRILAAIRYCRVKKFQASSYKKTNSSVALVARALQSHGLTAGEKLMKSNARALKVRISETKSPKKSPKKMRHLRATASTPKASPKKAPAEEIRLPVAPAGEPRSSREVEDRLARLQRLYGGKTSESRDDEVVSVSDSISVTSQVELDADVAESSTVKADAHEQANGSCKFVESFNAHTLQMTKVYTDGSEEIGVLARGPCGFATVQFKGEEPKQTEVPNILLEPLLKTSAGNPARQKLAAAETAAGDEKKLPAVKRGELVRKRPAAASSVDAAAAGIVADNQDGKVPYKSSDRHRHYSKVYHSKKLELERDGLDKVAAKALAGEAARKSCSERFG